MPIRAMGGAAVCVCCSGLSEWAVRDCCVGRVFVPIGFPMGDIPSVAPGQAQGLWKSERVELTIVGANINYAVCYDWRGFDAAASVEGPERLAIRATLGIKGVEPTIV